MVRLKAKQIVLLDRKAKAGSCGSRGFTAADFWRHVEAKHRVAQ